MPTTSRGFRYPSASAAPNVPQDIQNLATDINDDLNKSTTWVEDYKSVASYNEPIISTAFSPPAGGGPYNIVVPTGRTLEVQYYVPLVDLPAGTGVQADITFNGGTGQGWRASNSNAASIGLPLTFTARHTGTGASVAVGVRVKREGAGSGNPALTGSGVGYATVTHRIV